MTHVDTRVSAKPFSVARKLVPQDDTILSVGGKNIAPNHRLNSTGTYFKSYRSKSKQTSMKDS